MRKIIMGWFTDQIPPYAPLNGKMPSKPIAFIFWCLQDSYSLIFQTLLLVGTASLLSIGSAWMIGLVVDWAKFSGPDTFWPTYGFQIIMLGMIILVIRPIADLGQLALTLISIKPNIQTRIETIY